MKLVIDKKLPPDQGPDFLFQQETFIGRTGLPSEFLTWVDEDGTALAGISFHAHNNYAISSLRSSFGGFWIAEACDFATFGVFVDEIIDYYHGRGFDGLEITMYPDCYATKAAESTYSVLSEKGFRTSKQIDQYLPVNKRSFGDQIDARERRYLNHAQEAGLIFKMADAEELGVAYDLFAWARQNKGYPLTMTEEALKAEFDRFPQHYLLFGLYDEKEMVAASVCVRISNEVLYDFYHGDAQPRRKHSPVVPLIKNIYEYAQTHHFQVLDLGVSSEGENINRGLFDFKRRLGAVVSPKYTYRLQL